MRIQIFASFVLFCLLAATYWLYSLAFTADFNFDDIPNLGPLAGIHDWPTAIQYIFSGNSGPLGRPIALATFALQFASWPYSPQDFLYTNTLVHLLNGVILAWVFLRLADVMGISRTSAIPVSVTLCGLWLLHPLLTSTTLMSVQRMTGLSGFFALVGLLIYLTGRLAICDKPVIGAIAIVLGTAVFTALATLSKEIGVLLPVFVLVVEYTLLATRAETRFLLVWRRSLALYAVILLLYILTYLPGVTEQTIRGFSPWQRFLTEGKVLWEYLALVFFPRASALGPFQDDFPIVRTAVGEPVAILTWLGWILVLWLAIALRKSRPWFSFGAIWFFVGHSLESNIINLEIYFEHRNYLPSVGPLAAFSVMIWQRNTNARGLKCFLVSVYMGLFALVLYGVTLTWGRPDLAAHLWMTEHPNSERALQFLSQRFTTIGDHENALEMIQKGFYDRPKHTGFALQTLQLSCYLHKDVTEELDRVMPVLEGGGFSFAVIDALTKLSNMNEAQWCPGLTDERLINVVNALLRNQNFSHSKDMIFNLHHAHARIFARQGELDLTMASLESAFDAKGDLDTLVLMVGVLKSAGLVEEALKKLELIELALPLNPILRRQWINKVQELRSDIVPVHGRSTLSSVSGAGSFT